jgi:hypothetical protein
MTTASPTQLRIRITPQAMVKYRDLPPLARQRVVSMILSAEAERVDLNELLAMRKVLVNLGTLLNQSLRTSWGQATDGTAAADLVGVLRRVVS